MGPDSNSAQGLDGPARCGGPTLHPGGELVGQTLAFGQGLAPHALAAGVAEVSVDRASGKIKVHNVWVAIDAGIAYLPPDRKGQGLVLQTALLRDRSGNAAAYDLFLFDGAPAAPADKAAVALSAADLAKCIDLNFA